MKSYKLKDYQLTERNLNKLLTEFNGIKLNDTTKHYLEGLSLEQVDTDTILNRHRFDKASRLPSFTDYIAVGIDLSQQIPHCEVTKVCLESITNLIHYHAKHTDSKLLKGVSYTKKGFAINTVGEKLLADSIIQLDDEQAKVFETVQSLFNQLTKRANTPQFLTKILSEDIANSMGGAQLWENTLATILKNHFIK